MKLTVIPCGPVLFHRFLSKDALFLRIRCDVGDFCSASKQFCKRSPSFRKAKAPTRPEHVVQGVACYMLREAKELTALEFESQVHDRKLNYALTTSAYAGAAL